MLDLPLRSQLLASRHKTHHVFNFIPKDVHQPSSSLVPDIDACHPEALDRRHSWMELGGTLLSTSLDPLPPLLPCTMHPSLPLALLTGLLLPPIARLLPLPCSSFPLSPASIAASGLTAV